MNMKSPYRRCVLFTGLLLAAASVACYGRVFMFWNSAAHSTRTLRDLGGEIAYESTVSINGGNADFSLFSFDLAPSELLPQLQRAFGIRRFGHAGRSTAIAAFRSGNTMIRLIALQLNDPHRTLVFKIEQAGNEFETSNIRPTGHLLTAVPHFPGSEPEFHVKDENTDSSLAISRSGSPPEIVRDFFSSRLLASGWTSALGPTDGIRELLRDQSMALYIKRHHVCCVMVLPAGTGTSRITLLHKTQGMK